MLYNNLLAKIKWKGKHSSQYIENQWRTLKK